LNSQLREGLNSKGSPGEVKEKLFLGYKLLQDAQCGVHGEGERGPHIQVVILSKPKGPWLTAGEESPSQGQTTLNLTSELAQASVQAMP
jgi:hypothetical protein